jgi:phosphotransferase system HPr (HPr) family protein
MGDHRDAGAERVPRIPETQEAMNGKPLQHKVLITNPQGFHLRPMAAFAELAGRFQCTVTVSREGVSGNGKSTLDLMLLAAPPGSELTLEVEGPDAPQALEALVALLQTPTEEDSQQPPLSRKG